MEEMSSARTGHETENALTLNLHTCPSA